jgi:hypothetical protein
MAPFIDRFAYEWMWWHGYWGVPVEPNEPPVDELHPEPA